MSASSIRPIPSDDAFYENLTLGLIKVLGNIPRITNINYDKRNPAERNSVNAWEVLRLFFIFCLVFDFFSQF